MKHIGLMATALYWVVVGYILYKWGPDSSKTISDHVATGRQKNIYAPLALVYLALFSWFMFTWFLPNMNGQPYQYVLLGLSIVFLLLTFLIPRHGKYIELHDAFATVVGCSIWLVITSIVLTEANGLTAVISALALLSMLTIGTLLVKRGRKYYLQAQVFYFAMIHTLILLLTYTA